MSAPSILKEFLVSIGFSVDDQAYKRFKSYWSGLGSAFEETSTKVAGAAIAIGAAILEISEGLDKLYFTSQRTGESATNIQALEETFKAFGSSAEVADQAVEGLASALRNKPGLGNWLKSFGIDPKSPKVEILFKLVDLLRRMPAYKARSIAAQFGISESSLLLMEQNYDELKKTYEARKLLAKQLGLDPDQQVREARRIQAALAELETAFKYLGQVLFKDFGPYIERVLDWFKQGVDWIIKLDKQTDGASTKWIALGVAIGGVTSALLALKAAGSVAGWALGIGGRVAGGAAGAAGAAGGAGAGAAGAGAGAAAGGGIIAGAAGAVVTGLGIAVIGALAVAGAIEALKWLGNNTELGKAWKKKFNDFREEYGNGGLGKKLGMYFEFDKSGVENPDGTPKGGTPRAAKDFHNPGNLRAWGDAPTEERIDPKTGHSLGKFAVFKDDDEGTRAQASQLLLYGKRGLDSIKKIIDTWAPEFDKEGKKINNTPEYEKFVSDKTGVGVDSKFDVTNPMMLAKLIASMDKFEGNSDPDEGVIAKAVAYKLGQEKTTAGVTMTLPATPPPVQITQTTTIRIEADKNPAQTAQRVVREQDAVNKRMIRNSTVKVQ